MYGLLTEGVRKGIIVIGLVLFVCVGSFFFVHEARAEVNAAPVATSMSDAQKVVLIGLLQQVLGLYQQLLALQQSAEMITNSRTSTIDQAVSPKNVSTPVASTPDAQKVVLVGLLQKVLGLYQQLQALSLAENDPSLPQISSPLVPVVLPTPPPTLTFTASPISIVAGQVSRLTWKSSNANNCVLNTGTDPLLKTYAQPLSGSVTTGKLTKTNVYTMYCNGDTGYVHKSVTVTVAGGVASTQSSSGVQTSSQTTSNSSTIVQQPTLTFSASPTTLVEGQTSLLTWEARNALVCYFDAGTDSQQYAQVLDMKGVVAVGSVLHSTNTYTIFCYSADGQVVSKSVVVTVAKPTIAFQGAVPATIVPGKSFTLSWSSSNVPADSAVVLSLVNSQTGVNLGVIARQQPTTGSYLWTVPNTTSLCPDCGGIQGIPPPGTYKVVAKLYTPTNAWLGDTMPTANPILPKYVATGTSTVFTISVPLIPYVAQACAIEGAYSVVTGADQSYLYVKTSLPSETYAWGNLEIHDSRDITNSQEWGAFGLVEVPSGTGKALLKSNIYLSTAGGAYVAGLPSLYRILNDGKLVCPYGTGVPTATITSSLTVPAPTGAQQVTMSGTATNVSNVNVAVTSTSGGSWNSTVPVTNGVWTKNLGYFSYVGSYTITVRGDSIRGLPLVTKILVVK